MSVELAIALVGAAGTVVSAWLVSRVHAVQRSVNGHTQMLEQQIAELRARLEEQRQLPPDSYEIHTKR